MTMRTAHVFLLCMLGAALLPAILCNNGIGPDDCCFKFYPRRMNKALIGSYYMTDFRCPKTGAILVTKKTGRHICVDPNLFWVENIMRTLDENA